MAGQPSKGEAKITISEPMSDAAALPRAVAAIRQKILQACATRDIEALRIPIDWNEVRPLFERAAGRPPGEDPIARLKALSFDGAGQEVLTLLRNVLRQSFVVETRGKAQMYVWPAFALRPPSDPTPEERQIMLACVRFSDLARADASGRPPPMRVGLAGDGVWHYFWSVGPEG
ncbi:MAG: hypothetical protein ACK5JM_09035 [Rhodoblastus sp.]